MHYQGQGLIRIRLSLIISIVLRKVYLVLILKYIIYVNLAKLVLLNDRCPIPAMYKYHNLHLV